MLLGRWQVGRVVEVAVNDQHLLVAGIEVLLPAGVAAETAIGFSYTNFISVGHFAIGGLLLLLFLRLMLLTAVFRTFDCHFFVFLIEVVVFGDVAATDFRMPFANRLTALRIQIAHRVLVAAIPRTILRRQVALILLDLRQVLVGDGGGGAVLWRACVGGRGVEADAARGLVAGEAGARGGLLGRLWPTRVSPIRDAFTQRFWIG